MLVFKEQQLKTADLNWLAGRPLIHTSVCENLHAKCYLNENEAIITSMNLYEFSQEHNREMGIDVSREQDPELYAAILEGAKEVIRGSEEVKFNVSQVPKTAPSAAVKTKDDRGYCIRCHEQVKLASPRFLTARTATRPGRPRNTRTTTTQRSTATCAASQTSLVSASLGHDCYKKDELCIPSTARQVATGRFGDTTLILTRTTRRAHVSYAEGAVRTASERESESRVVSPEFLGARYGSRPHRARNSRVQRRWLHPSAHIIVDCLRLKLCLDAFLASDVRGFRCC